MAKTLPASTIADAAERAAKIVSEKYKLQFAAGLCCKHILVGRIVKDGIDFKTSLAAATTIATAVSKSLGGIALEPSVQFGRGYLIAGFINPDILDFGGIGPNPLGGRGIVGPGAPAKKKK
jgi:hypothetical protein